MASAAVFGIPVANSLSSGGFQDPTAESTHALNLQSGKFNQGDTQLLITVSSDDGVNSGAAQRVGTDIVRQLGNSPYVAHVTSPWTAPPSASTTLVSKDGKTGLIVASITGGNSGAAKHAETLSYDFVYDRDGVTVRAGGRAMTDAQITLQTREDLKVMEFIAVPVSFLVLVWVFGGFLAAAIPLAVGGVAIFGSMAALRALTFVTDVSIFALNLLLAMGLALAIDYTLLIISRFRDELDNGAERDAALVRTMASAGRSVLFSAMTVSLSMSTLVLFPMPFLKSFAYAAIAVVAITVIAAIVVTPAAIALLGPRLDSKGPRWLRRRSSRANASPRPVEQTFFYRLARFVIRRAVPLGLAIVALLIALGMPVFGLKWGIPDDRVLPTSSTARQVGDQLRADFSADVTTNVTVVIPDIRDVTPEALNHYAALLSLVPDVPAVSAPGGTFVAGALVGPPSAAAAIKDGSAFLTVASSAPLFSQASNTQLDRLHAIRGPSGQQVLMSGVAQVNRDTADAITSRVPLVLTVIAVITFVVMFALTRSVVMPLKTLLLSGLSLSAAFGALVWIFQDGHLGGLGTTATGTLVLTMPVMLFCIAFGLSMDYEVFLVSRIHEHWLESNRTAADNDESVALGLARTGRVITAAALIMSISFAALIAAQVSFMRMFGVGLTLAVLADATLVRMLLVPAFMHVMGRMNWWAPKRVARQRKMVPDAQHRREAQHLSAGGQTAYAMEATTCARLTGAR
ncbi:MAG TPA: MMPL family transporter [Mycobacterium sp.]|uniref:MMPL family transporter n=1 Tax=Mycobacterium sp. TaxID=1785 RepID=UPI002BC43C3A|nr:MMPL family transporter [Mycobacterium sp.]HME78721.1 MMPL family transporter [Mycobacterium sp.]